MVEGGLVKFKLLENLPKAQICPQNLGGTERQLKNRDLIMTYLVMLTGFATAIAVFLSEVVQTSLRLSIEQLPNFPIPVSP